MQTLIILVSMFAAQGIEMRQEGKGNKAQGERVVVRESTGTLLDMLDGTSGGWAQYAMEGGAGGSGSKAEVLVPAGGGGMAMKAAPGSRGGSTLLDLIDR